ncbi:MAG: sensor domain-containing diguanylate cyclase [Longimicrobiales bacterium]|nr:sensor domain-containing diguanylate cyclase [Longimicrobiales bacterium]
MPPVQAWSYFVPDMLAFALAAATAVHLRRRAREAGAWALVWMSWSVAGWAALDAAMAGTGAPGLAVLLARLLYVPQVGVALGWLVFALEYTGQSRHLRRWPAVVVFALGAATVLLAVAGDPTGWLVRGGTLTGAGGAFGLVPEYGVWRPVHQGWFWGSIIYATGTLGLHLAQSQRHVNRLGFVLGAPLMAAAAQAVSGHGWPLPVWVDLHPLGAALAAAGLGWSLFQVDGGNVAPVARTTVVEEMEDAVVVLDRDNRIVDVNRSARERLGLRLLGPLPVELAAAWTSVRRRLGDADIPVSERVPLRGPHGQVVPFEMRVTMMRPGEGSGGRAVLVLRDITTQEALERELRSASAALSRLAHTDELTGLANRRSLMDRLREEVDRAHRYGRPLTLVLLDLDHFKRVNDQWGHAAGDEVLRVTARALERISREQDLPGRMGGEEFAVVLPETDAAGGRILADRLRLEIGRCTHETDSGETFRVTASLGVATLAPGSGTDMDTLVQRADVAMYRAKELGRNRVALAG